MNDIIVSGLDTMPQTYAWAVTVMDSGKPTVPEFSSLE